MMDIIYSGYRNNDKNLRKYFSNQALLESFLRASKYNIKIIKNNETICYPKGMNHIFVNNITNNDCDVILREYSNFYKIEKNTVNLPETLLALICNKEGLKNGFTINKDKISFTNEVTNEIEYPIDIDG